MCGFLLLTGKEQNQELVEESAKRIAYRGPDDYESTRLSDGGQMHFFRLSIMDPTEAGNQPFVLENNHWLVCNGEIYNWKELRSRYFPNHQFSSDSDCEVITPLVAEFGIEKAAQLLDGEFAFAAYDKKSESYIAARDHMGIRPLFYGYSKTTSKIAFASEAKVLRDICDDIKPFPPGHYYKAGRVLPFTDSTTVQSMQTGELAPILEGINKRLTLAVEKRLQADMPVGFLLSGGLDSSLVCAIAAKKIGKIKTFAIGIEDGPIDTKYARQVADYIGSDHHEVLFSKEEVFSCLSELIYNLETYDITTVRASVGMYLLCKYIREKTDVRVVLTGEVSDELFGYKYTDYAPSALEFQNEAAKRIKELYLYDVLRADRCISSNSLEARVPFSDQDFVSYVMSIDPEVKMNTTGIGKYLLRKAFEGDYLPQDILYRDKAAFSDAVGHSMVDYLKEYANERYSEQDLAAAKVRYTHVTPHTKEALLYREIFESHFAGQGELIPSFWLPNKEWENCDVEDPSARVLPNYGKSGE